ncbi:MAG: hypothetical protein H7144_15570 [Burkholderiales bacterium]|nr:hypothetical protein [Phycisphaerae bacterium]
MMMPLRIVVTSAVASAFLCLSTPAARADLPKDVREAKSHDTTKSSIDAYVAKLVTQIAANDAKSGVAREELASQSDVKGPIAPTASFNLTYISSVSTGIQPLLKHQEAAVRLNGAIVVHRLAVATQQATLQPLVEQVMNDTAPAVQLWGVKAAGVLLPSLFSNATTLGSEKLSAGIVACVKKNPRLGAVVQEAYKAFDLTAVTPALGAPALVKATDRMNEVLAFRVQQYAAGMPADPQSERAPPLYLIKGVVTKANTPKQTNETMQNLSDLLAVSAQRTVALQGADRARMQNVVSGAAGSIRVLVPTTKDVTAIFNNLANVQAGAVMPAMAAVVNEIKKVSTYSALRDPPTVKLLEQAVPPAATAGG